MKTLVVIILMLVVCSCHKLKDGTVVSKYIEPAHTYRYPIFHRVGKVSFCTWHTGYDDEDYVIKIDGFDDDGVERVESFYVAKSKFDCLHSGDAFHVDKNCTQITDEH